MTPFILTLNFKTPLSTGNLPTLDAILAAEIANVDDVGESVRVDIQDRRPTR